jgi:hypothetical protein
MTRQRQQPAGNGFGNSSNDLMERSTARVNCNLTLHQQFSKS